LQPTSPSFFLLRAVAVSSSVQSVLHALSVCAAASPGFGARGHETERK